jgi:hypothetical protein
MTPRRQLKLSAVVDKPSNLSSPNPPVPQPSWLFVLNSRVILSGVVALLTISAATIAFPVLAGSAVGYLGAVLGAFLFLPFGIGVFLSVDRRSLRATRGVALCCFGVAGITVFGVVSNIAEALSYRQPIDPLFLAIFCPTGFGIAAYFTASGIAFRHWRVQLQAASGSSRSGASTNSARPIPDPR